jgi:hypothetical protein
MGVDSKSGKMAKGRPNNTNYIFNIFIIKNTEQL